MSPRSDKLKLARAARRTIPWPIGTRDFLPFGCEIDDLAMMADEPGNHKQRKPAWFLLLYAADVSREEIRERLNASEDSLARWFEKWIDCGNAFELQRLSDTSLETVLDGLDDEVLRATIIAAVNRVRAPACSPYGALERWLVRLRTECGDELADHVGPRLLALREAGRAVRFVYEPKPPQ